MAAAKPRATPATTTAGRTAKTTAKPAATKTAKTTATKTAKTAGRARKPGTKAAAAQRRAMEARRAELARPPVSWSDVTASAPTSWAGRSVGAFAVGSAVLQVLAALTTYVVVSGRELSAPLDQLSVLVLLVTVAGLAGPGTLLLLGRGGRTALYALLPFAATAPGALLLLLYETVFGGSHAGQAFYGRDFFFGRSYPTATVEAGLGHQLAVVAQVALLAGLLLSVWAWRSDEQEDRAPLGERRAPAAGFAVAAGMFGAFALAMPPAAAVVRTTTGADGVTVVPQFVLTPAGPLETTGLAQVGGLLLAAGLLAVGVGVGLSSSRRTMLGGLVGLAAYTVAGCLLSLRDVARNADLVPGVRTYALLAAAVVATAGAVYVARVRRSADELVEGGLQSAAESRLGRTVDESAVQQPTR